MSMKLGFSTFIECNEAESNQNIFENFKYIQSK